MYGFAIDNHLAMRIARVFSLQRLRRSAHDGAIQDREVETDLGEYLQAIGIDDPRTVLPLQMADLVANEFYHEWIAIEYDANAVWTRPVLAEATKAYPAPYGACYSGEGMRLAVERHARAKKAASSA